MQTLYSLIERFWNRWLLGPDWSPLVWIPSMLGSECAICSFWRGVFLGGGVALMAGTFYAAGFILVVLVFILAIVEKFFIKD